MTFYEVPVYSRPGILTLKLQAFQDVYEPCQMFYIALIDEKSLQYRQLQQNIVTTKTSLCNITNNLYHRRSRSYSSKILRTIRKLSQGLHTLRTTVTVRIETKLTDSKFKPQKNTDAFGTNRHINYQSINQSNQVLFSHT